MDRLVRARVHGIHYLITEMNNVPKAAMKFRRAMMMLIAEPRASQKGRNGTKL
jgi:hypothetical protein